DGRAGVLVEPGNAHALASALDGLLADALRARTVGERAANHARAPYSLPRMVGRYANLYERALGASDEALSRLSAAPDFLDVRPAGMRTVSLPGAYRGRRMGIAGLVSILVACGSSPNGPSELQSPGAGGALFSDDFESGTLATWEDGVDPTRHQIVS